MGYPRKAPDCILWMVESQPECVGGRESRRLKGNRETPGSGITMKL